MTRGLIVLVAAATMGAAILPAPAQAGGSGGAVAAGVLGGLAAGAIIGGAAAQPRYYAPAPVYVAPPPPSLLLDPRRAGVGRLSRRVGAPARAGLRLTGLRPQAAGLEFERPRRPRGRFFLASERVAPPGIPPIVRANFDATDADHAERRHQKGRARLFRRARHLDHPEVAADHLRLRGRHLHGRPRPGRGACARAREGAAARHQAGQHFHRGPARGVRSRLRVPDVPRQHACTRGSTCSAPRSRGR